MPTVLVCFGTVLMGLDLAGRLSSARGRRDLTMGPWRAVAGLRPGGTQLYGVRMIPARSRLGAVAVSLLGGALLMAGCAAGNPAGTGKPSPSPKPTTSASTGSGKYLPSKWVNSKGVFVAPADSGASASLKAQWETAYGVLPPPQGFVSGLGQVPVNNQTALPQSEANTLGEEFLVAQGYLSYFLTEGSLTGALAASAGSAIGAFPQVQSVLLSGGRVEIIGCQLPITLVLVSIPHPPGPVSGASRYGFVETPNTAPGGSCSIVTIAKSGQKSTVAHGIPSQTLQEGQSVQVSALGMAVWRNVGSWSCPTYAPTESVGAACPSLLVGGAG